MKMKVNAELCTGCSACVEICPSGAIRLNDGLAVLGQSVCTQCQACMDVCPTGAITTVDLPVAVTTLAAVQPVREAEIVVAEPIPSSHKPWLSAALVFAGRDILPRLVDVLLAALDRRLMQAQPAKSQISLPSQNADLPRGNSGRGFHRRSRFGQSRHRGRGLGRGASKRNWF